jgi:hypothetical protein
MLTADTSILITVSSRQPQAASDALLPLQVKLSITLQLTPLSLTFQICRTPLVDAAAAGDIIRSTTTACCRCNPSLPQQTLLLPLLQVGALPTLLLLLCYRWRQHLVLLPVRSSLQQLLLLSCCQGAPQARHHQPASLKGHHTWPTLVQNCADVTWPTQVQE